MPHCQPWTPCQTLHKAPAPAQTTGYQPCPTVGVSLPFTKGLTGVVGSMGSLPSPRGLWGALGLPWNSPGGVSAFLGLNTFSAASETERPKLLSVSMPLVQ